MEHIISVEAVNDLHTFILVCSCGTELTTALDGLDIATLAELNELAAKHTENANRLARDAHIEAEVKRVTRAT